MNNLIIKPAFKILIISSLFLFLFPGCEDDKKDFHLDSETLQQTSWEGTLTEIHGETKIKNSEVSIIFYTSKEGRYDMKRETDVITEPFTYYVDKKMLFIEQKRVLGGYWFLIEKNKERMVLEQGTGGEFIYKATLVLERRY
ncbi:MAG: hypothetical protein VB075_09380 [Petrimonas sp.]|uniref:hypothetical protein n=1 Tax=Petrimonas sp. TaxID=2023866 RepID=UPI002B37773E|nr:hypothetical protein [Petrimonas sp.]MEA5044763.1 hypothetical protein [Petrimonas sp.]